MTVEEKVAQLGSAWVFQLVDGDGFSLGQTQGLAAHGLGHVTRVSGASSLDAGAAAALSNEIQGYLVDGRVSASPRSCTRRLLGPDGPGIDRVPPGDRGREHVGARARPRAGRCGPRADARDGRPPGPVAGARHCRDPRWGRTEETFGEDPYLVARMGVEFVRGLQGDDLREGVVATAKHLVGYGASEGGMNWAPARIGACELHDVYLHPFEATVRDAGLRSVMNAYNEVDGMPCAADRELLTGLLRGAGVRRVGRLRLLRGAPDRDVPPACRGRAHAAARALDAGIDVELPGTDCYGAPLLEAVRSGLVAEAVLDEAVRRVLATKFELGLFERPFVDAAAVAGAIGMDAQRPSPGRSRARASCC